MQSFVRDTYLRVIAETINNARTEFTEASAPAETIAHLDTLKSRWSERLMQTQDFSEDPTILKGGAARAASAASGAAKRKKEADAAAGPSAKRQRTVPNEDDENFKDGSDLGSSSGDSDIRSAGSDPEVDNFLLAQHVHVRKSTGKWKVQLKEGIAHINGRDYLFQRATCDLDW